MKKLGLLVSILVLLSIYAPISLATYTVIITNRSPCHISYGFGGSSNTGSINAGQTAGLSVSDGQYVSLYMYTTMANSYPACGYPASTGLISLYYDSAQQSYAQKVQQGTSISGARPFYQEANLGGNTYTVNGGQTKQVNVKNAYGTISTTVYGGNIK